MSNKKMFSYYSEVGQCNMYEYIVTDDSNKEYKITASSLKGAYIILSQIKGYKIYPTQKEIENEVNDD